MSIAQIMQDAETRSWELHKLVKARVKAHQRKLKDGRTITVKEHERKDRGTPAPAAPSGPPRPLLDEHADHLERMEREARAAGHHGHAERLAAVRAAMQEPVLTPEEGRVAFHRAFDAARFGNFNIVRLAELKRQPPFDRMSMERFHAIVHSMRGFNDGDFNLGIMDGRHHRPTPEEHAAAIEERGERYHLLQRRGEAPADVRAAMRASPSLDTQVRAAIRALKQFPGHLINIADVRERLGNAPRGAVDDALKRLHDARVINLMPNENLKSITDRDRAAAIRLGETDRHLLVID